MNLQRRTTSPRRANRIELQVLACCIVIVFIVALFKLWWTNRQLHHQEQLDEEKRARLTEMRRAGLSPSKKRAGNIPFGIRAIQSGVGVEGIWISQPTTPSRSSSKSMTGLPATTTAAEDAAAHSQSYNLGHQPYPVSILAGGRPISQRPATSPLAFDTHSNMSTPLPQISEDVILPAGNTDATPRVGASNEEALRRVQNDKPPAATRSPRLPTYMPSSHVATTPDLARQHGHQQQSQAQKSQHYNTINGHYRPSKHIPRPLADSVSISGARSTRSYSSLSVSSRPQAGSDGGGFAGLDTSGVAKGGYGQLSPVSSPVRLPTSYSHSVTVSHPAEDAAMALPPPTFGPADSYANRANRKISSGFEVLPAGTFGGRAGHLPHDSSRNFSTNGEVDDPGTSQRMSTMQSVRKKLRRSGPT